MSRDKNWWPSKVTFTERNPHMTTRLLRCWDTRVNWTGFCIFVVWPQTLVTGDQCFKRSFPKITRSFTITENAPTRAFSWLKAATTAFTFKTVLRYYSNSKHALTPRSLNVKLGPRRNYHKGRAAIRLMNSEVSFQHVQLNFSTDDCSSAAIPLVTDSVNTS